MSNIERANLTKELIRAQDAIQSAFQSACRVSDLDLAADLRRQRAKIGDAIVRVNGGPLKVSKTELLGAFR